MPINGVLQPDILSVNEKIRLRKYDGNCHFALPWYQDENMVYLVDGKKESYSLENLKRMYRYLNEHGELYFIEVKEGGRFVPIGDVTFWQDDMPIVIGDPAYRGMGIGKSVISRLIQRGKEIGYPSLFVREIYEYNLPSQKAFESAGFVPYEKTDKGYRYRFDFSL